MQESWSKDTPLASLGDVKGPRLFHDLTE